MEDKICCNCNKEFTPDSKRRKFCNQVCATTFNNKHRNRKRSNKNCLFCKKIFYPFSSRVKFCTVRCSADHKSLIAYQNVTNNTGETYSPRCAKKHILKEQENKCIICKCSHTWNDQLLIFILDHIDGDSTNNKRENLRLVCPNCDSQLPTYKSKNKNSGRHYRTKRRREGKSF